MARIRHPRATDAVARAPPGSVTVPIGRGSYDSAELDEDGYVDVADEHADDVMEAWADAYDVEYTDDGELVTTSGDGAADADAASDSEAEAVDVDTDTEEAADETDVDEWADWNEEDWLSMNYQDRVEDVREGRVDDYLDEIADVERSTSVEAAVEERQAEREDTTE